MDDVNSIDASLASIEKKSFSSKDLDAFSALSQQHAQNTFDDRMVSVDEKHEISAPKRASGADKKMESLKIEGY